MPEGAPSRDLPKIVTRITPEMKAWLTLEAKRNASSQNSEVFRCIRERMEKEVSGHAK